MENPNLQKVRFRTIIEVLGKPKEHVETAIKKFVDSIREDDNFAIITEEFASVKEQEGGVFSLFVELEIVSKSLQAMIGFCFDYMPSSMEILKPDELTLKSNDISNMLTDLQARLHKVDMIAKSFKMESDFLKRNMNVLMTNLVSLLLKSRKLNKSEISKFTGISEKEIDALLERLINDAKIKKEGEVYTLA